MRKVNSTKNEGPTRVYKTLPGISLQRSDKMIVPHFQGKQQPLPELTSRPIHEPMVCIPYSTAATAWLAINNQHAPADSQALYHLESSMHLARHPGFGKRWMKRFRRWAQRFHAWRISLSPYQSRGSVCMFFFAVLIVIVLSCGQ